MQLLLDNSPLSLHYVQIHTLFEMQILVQAHIRAHAQTEVPSVSLRHSDHNKAYLYINIYTFFKRENRCDSIQMYTCPSCVGYIIIAIHVQESTLGRKQTHPTQLIT